MARFFRGPLRVAVFALLLSPVHSLGADPVPDEYASLYINLGVQLNRFDAALDNSSPVLSEATDLCGDLVSANSHLGEQLLTPSQWSGTLLLLDRLQAMGVQGVKSISITPFSPLGSRGPTNIWRFIGSGGRDTRRNLTLLVQTQLTFTDPEFSPANCGPFSAIQVDYSNMTLLPWR